MTAPLRFLLSLAAVFCCLSIKAQPAGNGELPLHGCHFAKNKTALQPLSEAEKMLACGSNARSDSLDVLNYALALDVTNFASAILSASCEITFTPKQDSIERLPLDLLDLTVDSAIWQGSPLAFDYDGLLLDIHLPAPLNVGDTAKLTVFYHGQPTVDGSSFGGFAFDGGIAYNLGIGLSSNPYNFGRSWHPCFDNFVERATYDFSILTSGGKRGYAVGEFLGETDLGGGFLRRQYRMAQPLPTYLVGVAVGVYQELHSTHEGVYGDLPVLLLGLASDTADMKDAFVQLPNAIDALEAWFGAYTWGQVGYVLTTQGAMEHATLIAFPQFVVNDGPTPGVNRLIAHELAHHWWGNTTTLSCPSDMWIKEGNAEYGAHLFSEFAFGKNYFLDQVKDNHFNNVLKRAHSDDGGNYLALSGIPYEYTYGTHTYYKGASMMHNLRGYLGDTLFSQGMRSILETYEFEAVDAPLFRDQLTASTGVDMNPFFDAWIFNPGYSCFELDSVKYSQSLEGWDAAVFIQQKLHHAPAFHDAVPLSITFFDENWNTHTATVAASGEFTETGVLDVPFLPVWQVLNDDNRLNLARMQDRAVLHGTGPLSLQYAELTNFEVTALPADSALLSVVHYWGAADPVAPEQGEVQVSGTHYWRFGGVLPSGFKAKVLVPYRGGSETDFDFDLTGSTEDSLILIWRPQPGAPWGEYPWYKKLTLGGTTDGNGFIRIDTLLAGDYAFANGELPVATAAFEVEDQMVASVFPNPAGEIFTVEGRLPSAASELRLTLFDAVGRVVREQKALAAGGVFQEKMEAEGLPPGMYWLRVSDLTGGFGKMEKVVKR